MGMLSKERIMDTINSENRRNLLYVIWKQREIINRIEDELKRFKGNEFENSTIGTLGTEKTIAYAAYWELKKLMDTKDSKPNWKGSTLINRSSSMNLSQSIQEYKSHLDLDVLFKRMDREVEKSTTVVLNSKEEFFD